MTRLHQGPPPPPPRSSIRPWLRCLVPAVTLAAGLLALDLTFGLWFRSNPWERALTLNIIVNRQITYDTTGLYEGGGRVTYTRDRYGLRGNYGDPKNITILTIGGSTTDQREIDDGLTWQHELQRLLRADGKPATVANAGVNGHTTFGHLASYAYWFPLIPGLRPTYTIVYVGINDLLLHEPITPSEGQTDGTATLKDRIKANSAFYRLYAITYGTWLARRLRLSDGRVDFDRYRYVDTPRLRDHERLGRPGADAFKQRYVRLLQRVRESGSTPICITQPTWFYRIEPGGRVLGVDTSVAAEEVYSGSVTAMTVTAMNGVDYFHLRRMHDAIILASCQAVGAHTIDLAVAEWEAADFFDFIHMNPVGVKKLGARIAAGMKHLPWRS